MRARACVCVHMHMYFYHITPFHVKPSLLATPISENVSSPDEGPLLETLIFFEIHRGSYQPLGAVYTKIDLT